MAPKKIGRGKVRSLETPASSTPALHAPMLEVSAKDIASKAVNLTGTACQTLTLDVSSLFLRDFRTKQQ